MNKPFLKLLKGNKRFKRLLGDAKNRQGLRSGLVVLKPGELVGEHSTENKEEILIVLSGCGYFYYGKKTIILKENTFLYVPERTTHNVKNAGQKPLKYVYITANLNK
ncbi:MAG: cupin domain-containing protein [Candidatus Omnitrophica bacterium]|nr:cupin domain-containing protein [Candidatus Omnitrophota bacterium]